MKTCYVVRADSPQAMGRVAAHGIAPFLLFVYLPLTAVTALFEAVLRHAQAYAAAGWWIYAPFPKICAEFGFGHVLGEWALWARMMRGWHLLVLTTFGPLAAAVLVLLLYPFLRRFGLGVAVGFLQLRVTPWKNLEFVLWPVVAGLLQRWAVAAALHWLDRRGCRTLAWRIREGQLIAAVLAWAVFFAPFGLPVFAYGFLVGGHRLVLWLFA